MRYAHVFREDALAVRSEGRTQCPFCGGDAIVSMHDVRADPGRVELYCNNSNCDVREMAVIALRVGRWNPRADVLALEAVDVGPKPSRKSSVRARGTSPQRSSGRRRDSGSNAETSAFATGRDRPA